MTYTFKPRVARLKVQWLEDDAISANHRQYPKEAVDALVRSGQLTLSDPTSPPLTCYISHGAADQDSTPDLVGKITHVWKEGARAFAYIDVPDTQTGRDIASLTANNYIKTVSLRAEGAKMDRSKSMPQVTGEGLKLLGIDFTNTPGISSAQVQAVLLESSEYESAPLTEQFTLSSQAMLLETEKGVQMDDNKEAALVEEASVGDQGIPSTTSGESPSVTNGPTQDAYANRQYNTPPPVASDSTSSVDGGLRDAAQAAHDHSAACLGMSCAPSGVAAQEAGRALSAKNRKHLESIHTKAASSLGLGCAQNTSDGMQDGDADDQPQERLKKEPKKLDEIELAEALRKAGYKVEKEPTPEEKMRAEIAELKEMILAQQKAPVTEAAPLRRSVATGATAPRRQLTNAPYRHGQYLQEQLRSADWSQLADRTCPLPEGLNEARLLKEFADMYFVQYYDRTEGEAYLDRKFGVM